MKTEAEVEDFGQMYRDEPERLAAFEACIPLDFWDVPESDIFSNRKIFDEVVLPYCKKMHRARRRGYGLLFLGDNGVGKTLFLSFTLMRAIRMGYTAYYTTLPQLDYDTKCGFKDGKAFDRLRWLLTSDFLAVDEMGKEKFKSGDSYIRTQIERILKDRFDNSLPVLLASNANMSSLESTYGTSLTSILIGKYRSVTLESGDFRERLGERMRKEMDL